MLKKSIMLEDDQDTWRYEYDGRYRTLFLICKKAGEMATIKVEEFDLKVLDDALVLLSRLKQELFTRTLV